MLPIWLPAGDGGEPKKKRPVGVISATIPQTIAQVCDFVLQPVLSVLGFHKNPMPPTKATKWSKNDYFLTSYKAEKTMVVAAENVFTKTGGGSHIVKARACGSRYHVDMLVGHHALFASFVRNNLEVAIGRRQRRRGGNGGGTHFALGGRDLHVQQASAQQPPGQEGPRRHPHHRRPRREHGRAHRRWSLGLLPV
eukprot:TRINITY_DN1591_c0_g1_i4.p3 TRINITY_DN1591_c0_g1~~TRINITY_DN1591_c0_g1_i4.p3  ORF type:complete len:195 (+),score=28.67 TRINITY_DN1591_c0_g1_i4:503-1087(+)